MGIPINSETAKVIGTILFVAAVLSLFFLVLLEIARRIKNKGNGE